MEKRHRLRCVEVVEIRTVSGKAAKLSRLGPGRLLSGLGSVVSAFLGIALRQDPL